MLEFLLEELIKLQHLILFLSFLAQDEEGGEGLKLAKLWTQCH